MKTKTFKVKNTVDFASHRKAIKNAFTEEGAKAKDALLSLLDELESSETEYDVDSLKAEIVSALEGMEEVPEAVSNAIAKTMAAKVMEIQNSLGGNDPKVKFTPKVKNAISAAILKAAPTNGSGNYAEVKNAVDKIKVENQVTGLTFSEVIDYAIATKWEDSNPLYAQFYQTMMTKFFYTADEMTDAAVIAKQWDKDSAAGVEKDIQTITAVGKAITTDYVYKRQQVDAVDMDDIEAAGQGTAFLAWLTQELQMQTINTIVMAILTGDAVNAVGKRLTTFEVLGTKAATDAFTYVGETAVADTITVSEVREACDKVINRNGKKKVAIMSQSLLTALSGYVYATGGDTHYRTKEEMAGQFGVDEIYVTDLLGETQVQCIIPQGYWIRDKKTIQIAYPTWAENRQNYQYEKNIGGKIHDLQSSAVLNIKQS